MKALINGNVMAFDDVGAGPAVLLLHGFPLSRRVWEPQVGPLVDAGFRVIVPDLRGFGESAVPEEGYDMNTFADDIVALMNYLGVGRAVVGGMSMGGYVLLDLLARYPQRLNAAMFLVTRAAADDAAGREKRTALAAAVAGGDLLVVPEAFSGVLFAPQTPAEKPALVAEVRGWMEQTSPQGLIGGLMAIRDREDCSALVAKLDLPALVLGADADNAIPLAESQNLAAELPQATLVTLAGGGHMVNLEQPEAFNQALLDFLVTLPG